MLIVPAAEGGEQFLSSTFIDQPDGSVAFRDPISGEILTPNAVPDTLRTWPILKEGYDFWEQEGHRIDFTLLLSIHSRGADLAEAGIDLRAEALRVASKGGILFLEGVIDESELGGITRIYNEVSQGSASPDQHRRFITSREAGGVTFSSDILDLIYQTQARIEYSDALHSTTTQDVLNPMHTILIEWRKHIKKLRGSDGTPRNVKDFLVAETGYHNYREWLVLGLCGVKLSRFGHIDGSITGTLHMGAAHPNVASKTEVLTGRPVRVLGESSIPVHDPKYMYLLRGIGDAALSTSSIASFQAWCAGNARRL